MSENRLQHETSPYLLQHQDNPVHWWAWGPEALAEAKRTGKPILLSVGYAACHWCHVMAHESFEDAATADIMNGLFVNIKVDREERPDIDAIYMGALHRLGEQGGWPLTMFLDSEAKPFWGGTYFPRIASYGRPSFATVLLRIAEAYQNQPDLVASNACKIVESLKPSTKTHASAFPDDTKIRDLVARISRAVDAERGGLSGAPKFPQWNVFWLLWRGAIRFEDATARHAVLTTLTNICQGGIYDHLGGGFSRYSVDEDWLVPHFEKMLYDNALLIDLLTEAWRETQHPLYAIRIAETVDWLSREMIAEGGGFAASLDADSEGEEGKFYVWSAHDIDTILGADHAAFFSRVYGMTAEGNFEGHNILNRLNSQTLLSQHDEARLKSLREKLLAHRAQRIRPGWDDKVLADWNGLMIAALARTSVVFERKDWLAMAERAFAFIADTMTIGDHRLWHSYRAGEPKAPASASDYANMIWAALRLYQATSKPNYLEHAIAWTATLDRHYWDQAAGGYFTAADDTLDVIVRLKNAGDDAVPSANAIQLWNLIALSALTGNADYNTKARALLNAFAETALANPVGHCGLLAASMDLELLVQIAVPGDTSARYLAALKRLSVPGALEILVNDLPNQKMNIDFLSHIENHLETSVYICQDTVCGRPILEPNEIRTRLMDARTKSSKMRSPQ